MALCVSFRFNDTTYPISLDYQNQIIMEYAPLIKYLANKIVIKTNYSVEIDELVNCGVLGLIDAIEKYDDTRENKFKTYAEFRIRGAMLDYLRGQDWTPRSVRDKAKLIEREERELEEKLGRKPSETELAGKMQLSIDDFHKLASGAKASSFLSIEESLFGNENNKQKIFAVPDESYTSNPMNRATLASMKNIIASAIEDLPEREKMIIALYYYEEMNLKEIGAVLNISESRVSQLHSQAIRVLKERLAMFREDLESEVA
ncbi:MAG: FliA/WhiG family RNA polymerase sigma factor [Oligoflexia bacterium]|nr:FliA/WhiG family RNA polymerase sigma factor [Oligoflexia bacterium]